MEFRRITIQEITTVAFAAHAIQRKAVVIAPIVPGTRNSSSSKRLGTDLTMTPSMRKLFMVVVAVGPDPFPINLPISRESRQTHGLLILGAPLRTQSFSVKERIRNLPHLSLRASPQAPTGRKRRIPRRLKAPHPLQGATRRIPTLRAVTTMSMMRNMTRKMTTPQLRF